MDGIDRIVQCECGYETNPNSNASGLIDGYCPECGRSVDTETDQ